MAEWGQVPAVAAAAVMTAFGLGAALRPEALEPIGVVAVTPLGRSEIRAVFGGMFIALGVAMLTLREPLLFGVVGAAWLADVAVRSVAVIADRVPPREAAPVLAIGLTMGALLLSGLLLA